MIIDVYKLYIRSVLEYCSVAFHSSLTEEQSGALEAVQTMALKVCLGSMFVSPSVAREMTGIDLLKVRREARLSRFCVRASKHPRHSKMFPLNPESEYNLRHCDKFKVNYACTESYRRSALIKCQQKLNELAKEGKI